MSKVINLKAKLWQKYNSDEKFTDHDYHTMRFNEDCSYHNKAAKVLINNFVATYGNTSIESLIDVLKQQGYINGNVKVKKAV